MKNKFDRILVTLCLGIALAGILTVLSGCAGDKYNRSTGEYIDDKALSSRVNNALSDNQEYKFDQVSVTSFRGVVQLSGFVNTSHQKTRAGEIARNVTGVREVENNVTVKDKL